MHLVPFVPFPHLQTERHILRQLGSEDEEDLLALRSEESPSRRLARMSAKSPEAARRLIREIQEGTARRQWLMWAIVPFPGPRLAGTVGLWNFSATFDCAEIGYELLPAHQGKGILVEVLPRVLRFGFEEMGLREISAETSPRNARAIRVLERHGFRPEGAQARERICYLLQRP